jgi:hypothetical protein
VTDDTCLWQGAERTKQTGGVVQHLTARACKLQSGAALKEPGYKPVQSPS